MGIPGARVDARSDPPSPCVDVSSPGPFGDGINLHANFGTQRLDLGGEMLIDKYALTEAADGVGHSPSKLAAAVGILPPSFVAALVELAH
jgi:hypothetical protein